MSATRKAILAAMPGTRPELAEKTGIAYLATFRAVAALIKSREAHVSGWVGGHPGRPLAIVSAGRGSEARRPEKTTAAERVAASRARAKQREA